LSEICISGLFHINFFIFLTEYFKKYPKDETYFPTKFLNLTKLSHMQSAISNLIIIFDNRTDTVNIREYVRHVKTYPGIFKVINKTSLDKVVNKDLDFLNKNISTIKHLLNWRNKLFFHLSKEYSGIREKIPNDFPFPRRKAENLFFNAIKILDRYKSIYDGNLPAIPTEYRYNIKREIESIHDIIKIVKKYYQK